MQLKELIPVFDDAIKDKNEIEVYKTGYKIAFIYSKILERKKHLGFDCEFIADELALRCIEIAKKTDYQKESRYYWGILKTGSKYKYLQYLKNEKVLSLNALSTNEYGETFIDRMELKNAFVGRSKTEELRTDLVNEIIAIADDFKTKNETWEIMKVKYPEMEKSYFLRLVREFGIQFDIGRTRQFIDCMKVYNIYKTLNENRMKTINYLKENNIEICMSVKTAIDFAPMWLNLFQTDKKKFMNIFVNPPNMSTMWDKIGF